MALISINPARGKQELDPLQKVQIGVDLAKSILGLGLAIPEFLQKKNIAEQTADINKQELGIKKEQLGIQKSIGAREAADTKATIGTKYRPATPSDKQDAVTDFGDFGGKRVLINNHELTDIEKIYATDVFRDNVSAEPNDPGAKEYKFGGRSYYLKPKPSAGGENSEFNQEHKLRSQYNAESREFIQQSGSMGRILASAKDPSAAGDLALIFNYMKMLDPGSAVRETEFANAQNAASVPERVRAQWNKVFSGERLSEETRKDFINRSHSIYASAKKLQATREAFYKNIAESHGIMPSRVVQDFSFKANMLENDENERSKNKSLQDMSDEELLRKVNGGK